MKGKIITPNLQEELTVDEAGINDQLANQPALFAFYAVLYAQAKQEIEKYEALYISTLREHYSDKGVKISETRLKAELALDESYNTLKEKELVLKEVKEAFQQRKDMLISLASNLRAEGDAWLSRTIKETKGK